MKRIVITMLVLVSLVTVQAQEEMLRFGIKTGANFSNRIGDRASEFGTRTSFHLGVVTEIPLTERFALQSEMMYSGEGVRVSEKQEESSFESVVKIDYLQIPVLVKIYLIKGLSLEAGPQIGFLIAAKEVSKATFLEEGVEVKEVFDNKVNEEITSFVTAANFGLGYQFANSVFVGTRATFGFTKTFKNEPNSHSLVVLQLSVGYKF